MPKNSKLETRKSKIALPRPSLHISIIIPTLNEGGVIRETLAGIPPAPDLEIILVDGGSTDNTLEAASHFPYLRVLRSPRGRGRQMNVGALASRGEILAFLHADTHLTPAHLTTLRSLASDPGFMAGAFELALMPPLPALRLIAWGANLRTRLLGLPYGDQVLSVRRRLFFNLGGFTLRRPEDLDLVIRLQRHTRLRVLTPPVASSGRRWLEQGYFATTLKNWLFLTYHLAQRTLTKKWSGGGEWSGGGGQGSQTHLQSSPTPPPPTPYGSKKVG
ncbi:MAG: TIGR04283 family arsenosugar biosynthesis glycosyltransferase [Thermodesulfobacteriota bacterium]